MTTTTANLDSFQIAKEVHAFVKIAAGAVNETLFRALEASISEYCDASKSMIRLAARIEGDVVEITDKVNRSLGTYNVDSIGRYAAELAAAAAARELSARSISCLVDALFDGVNDPTTDSRETIRRAIFGIPTY